MREGRIKQPAHNRKANDDDDDHDADDDDHDDDDHGDDDDYDEKVTSVASPLPHFDSQAVHASQVVYPHLIKVIFPVEF